METAAVVFGILGAAMFLFGLYLLNRRIAILRKRGDRVLLSEYLGVEKLITCLLFIAFATIMIFLLIHANEIYCRVTIWVCIILYTANKIFLYVYLIEKAHIVNCVFRHFEKRIHSGLYMFNICSISLYAGVLTVMILFRKNYLDDDGKCHVGLKDTASATLLTFDTVYRIYLMSLFAWPLMRNASESAVVLGIARKNIFGCIVSLVCSFANIMFILVMHGNQKGYMCLFLCTLDVFVNVLIMDWLLTTHRDEPLKRAMQDLELVRMDYVCKVTHTLGSTDNISPITATLRPVFNHHTPPVRGNCARSSIPHKVTFADDIPTDDPGSTQLQHPTLLLHHKGSSSPCNIAMDISPPFRGTLQEMYEDSDPSPTKLAAHTSPPSNESLSPPCYLSSRAKECPDLLLTSKVPLQPSALHLALLNSPTPKSSDESTKKKEEDVLDNVSLSKSGHVYGREHFFGISASGGPIISDCRKASAATRAAASRSMSDNETRHSALLKYENMD